MRSKRKDEHLLYALEQDTFYDGFEGVRLTHQSLPSYDMSDVSLQSTYLNRTFETPIYINAMTGGSDKTLEVNKKLALLAQKHKLAMAVGSQHVALDDPQYEKTFRIVRENYPEGFLIGNVNANATVEEAKRAIEMIDANALGIHINPAQELTMDEGDRNFKHWIENISNIVASVDVPVIVKEVGNGMSLETVEKLIAIGVKHVDVSGRGGTNFIWIENKRSEAKRYDYLENWGLTTVESLVDNIQHQKKVEVIASGGVTSPLDVIKCLVLGAKAVGMSGMFLKAVMNNEEEKIDDFIEDLKKLLILVDVNSPSKLNTIRYHMNGR
ncbi:MAG: type 2 isopentenyl-diphosphate Delta-isomerase [Erysipelothrix sp.]|nr:type 2 isopentenyl-diphosphate Delta-isomerase [Erysipelothrix sp.]